MTATCDTCPNKANLELVIWNWAKREFRCINCANVQAAFEDTEPWDMTQEDAHPYNEPSRGPVNPV